MVRVPGFSILVKVSLTLFWKLYSVPSATGLMVVREPSWFFCQMGVGVGVGWGVGETVTLGDGDAVTLGVRVGVTVGDGEVVGVGPPEAD